MDLSANPTTRQVAIVTPNAVVQPRIRAQREFVGWNTKLGSTAMEERIFKPPCFDLMRRRQATAPTIPANSDQLATARSSRRLGNAALKNIFDGSLVPFTVRPNAVFSRGLAEGETVGWNT